MTSQLGHAPVHPVQRQLDPSDLDGAVVSHRVQPCDDRVIMTVMMMMTSLTQRDLGEGQEDGDHDDTRGDRAQYQEILTGMGGMPPPSSPILSLLGPLSTLLSRPASGRHPPAGAGATGQGQCFGHYRSQLSLFCRYNAYSDSSKQWDK